MFSVCFLNTVHLWGSMKRCLCMPESLCCSPETIVTLFISHIVLVQLLSWVWLLVTLWTAARQASLSIMNSGACSNSCPSSRWCHPAISPSVIPFSFCPQSLPASVFSNEPTLHMRWPKYWSFSFSIIPSKEWDWSPLEWTGWTSLQSKGLSRVFSNTTVQKHQFFCAQLSSQSNSHIHTWSLEKPYPRWLYIVTLLI